MVKKKKHSSHQDLDGLKKYLKGKSSSSEEHAIEKESLEDPFLEEALEGLGSHKPENIISDLDQLDTLIHTRSTTKKNTYTWMYRSAAAILVFAIASSIIYFLATRIDTISNQENISLKQDNIENKQTEYPEEKIIEEIVQKTDSGNISLPAVKEMPAEDQESLKPADIKQDVIPQSQETDIKGESGIDMQTLSEEKIEIKTLSIEPEPVSEEEIDYNLEIDESVTAIPQEFSVTEDLSTQPVKKQSKERLARSASPELSGVELSEGRQDLIVPEPADGFEDYEQYLSDSIKYPEDARINEVEGTVIVQCSISSDSLPIDCLVIKSLMKSCDEEAVRLIKEGPKWKLVSTADSDKPQKIVVEVEFRLNEN